jgi:diguanylate cyclase (GGDEF)-like protein
MTRQRLHTSVDVRVIREQQASSSYIIKSAAEHGDRFARLKTEWHILERLNGVQGCPRLVHFDKSDNTLVLEDVGGVSLDQANLLGALTLDKFLSLAHQLARIIASIHQHGVIHNDINPSNIIIRHPDMQLQVIDFDLSTTFLEERPEFESINQFLGTPAYLAPELTGRMNRPVDCRADLYSLGATLYALATGAPPFEETTLLGFIHAHLTRSPVPPSQRADWLPPRVSDLIMTLLAKEPDDRYQNATSLAHDLQLFRQALKQGASFDQIVLKQRDLPLSLRPPRRLYGRDKELATLTAKFESIAKGGIEALFVAGYSGVGKTSLLHEMHRDVTLGNGLFVSGKFEQFQRDRPFLAPTQSLRQLCHLLLAAPDAAIALLRKQILAGINTPSALFDLVPELQTLLGPQDPAPNLGPLETQIRLHGALVALFRHVASPARPVVLFLDDLQWADAPSLKFLSALLNEPNVRGLLIVGAYRDNEVDHAHPLMRVLRQPMASGQFPTTLKLSNLTQEDLSALLSDMLHMPAIALQQLTSALYAKTSGNPYYAVEYIRALHMEGILKPDPENGVWRWDDVSILMRQATVNVVDFLTSRLSDLPPATTEALVAAAYLGTECELSILAIALDEDTDTLTAHLTPALERGILFTPSALAFHLADMRVKLRFCHDRMQQAAARLYDDDQGGRLHFAMACRFTRAGTDPSNRFRAAEHYAAAMPLLVDRDERETARNCFLDAAVQARKSGAFAAAERFLNLGIKLLPQDAWRTDNEASLAMHTELHMALYSQSRNDEADEAYAVLAAYAASPLQLVWPTCVQVMSLSNRTRYNEAVGLARALIGKLGMDMPSDDALPSLQHELDLFYQHAASGELDNLPCRPVRYDPSLDGIARLMNRMIPAAFFVQPLLACWLAVRSGRQWMENGYQDSLIYPMACITLATIALRGDYATGIHAAEVALTSGQSLESGVETARSQHVWGLFNNHWHHPLETDVAHAHEAFDGLMSGGELEFACYTFFTSLAAVFDTCTRIAEMRQEVETALGFARKVGNRHGEQAYVAYQQLVRALEGKTSRPGSFDDAEFREQEHLDATKANPMALCYFHISRALAACVFNEESALIHHAEVARDLLSYITGFYPTVLANVLHSLALCRQAGTVIGVERAALLKRVDANQAWLVARAADAPMNFSHLHGLVESERLDILDRPWEAQLTYEQAMRLAQANQRPWHAALITERAGLFYIRRGLERSGQILLARAYDLYLQWGADGKARMMRGEYPFVGMAAGSSRGPSVGRRFSSAADHDLLDYEALLCASQALASETSQSRLVSRVVELVGQLTCATDVRFLLQDEDGDWFLEGGMLGSEQLERMPVTEAEGLGLLPASAFRLGLKILKPMVSDDAVIDTRFAGDPYFSKLLLCSLLTLPMLVQGRLSAFLILENRLYRAAFTTARTETASVLCSQLAISIENIRLYQSLERKVAQRTREIEEANRKLEVLSVTDGLTGLANRRKFDEVYEESWRLSARLGVPFSVALLDVDHFKAYNDMYGHQAGDACLQRIAAALKTSVRRAGDLVARYGGEEFVVILPGLHKDNAVTTCEKIRATIENLRIPHKENNGFNVVTVSIGLVSSILGQNDDHTKLLQQADAALYQAKSLGRNQVAVG